MKKPFASNINIIKHGHIDMEEKGYRRDYMEESVKSLALHQKERKLIEFIRELGYGELTIKVQDGLPVLIERATEKVKL